MAAAFKTSKSDLVAIYRLEFYKKQKNWKFCTSDRKKEEERRKAAKKAKAKLNQTYSIEPAPERDKIIAETETEEIKLETGEQVQPDKETEEQKEDSEPVSTEDKTDNLNEAFVDTETDVSTPPDDPPTGPYSPKWSIQQWAARCRSTWNQEPTTPQSAPKDPSQNVLSDPKQLYHVPSEPMQPYTVPSDLTQPYCLENTVLGQVPTKHEMDLLYKRNEMPRPGTRLPPVVNILNVDRLRAWEPVGCCEGEQGWPRQTQVWTNRQEGWFEEICDIPEEAIEAIEALEMRDGDGDADADLVDGAGAGAEWALLERAGDWLRSSSSLDKMPRSDSPLSISSGSFTRGAALAPHSTELDLTTGALSAAALAAAVAGHAAALHELLSEARRRDIQVSPAPADQLYSFDEYPTRDIGCSPHIHNETPLPPYTHTPTPSSVYTHNPTVVNDVFVAGSFNNRPDLYGQTEGRGRGRKVRIIGMEMGRPYRL